MTAGTPPALPSGTSGLLAEPQAASPDLLYVSSVENSKPNVLIYTYPKGHFKKKVNNSTLVMPLGECADRRGHVYVTNQGSSSVSTAVVEYAHGGTAPIRTLTVAGSASQCSVDPKTGDLAVISSQLAIFRSARGKPTYLSFPAGFERTACDYDDKGNLFINGVRKKDQSRAALVELHAGGSTFVKIGMPNIPEGAVRGDVRWDGKDLALGDGVNSIYQLAINGKSAKEVGIVQLYGGADVTSLWIQGGDIVGANTLNRSAMIWGYPGGGQPLKVLNNVGRGDGVAVSVAPRK